LRKELPGKLFALILYGLLAILAAVLFFRYLLAAVLPFVCAFAAASLLHRPSRKLSEVLHIPYRAVAVGLTVLSVSVFMGGFGFLIWKTVSEIGAFAGEALGGEKGLLENAVGIFGRIADTVASLPFVAEKDAAALRQGLTQALSEAVRNVLVSAASRFPAFAAKLISAVPQIFLFFVVTVLSAVYFCVDYEKIRALLRSRLPERHWGAAARTFGIVKRTAVQFIKSYFLLFLITFAGLFFGFAVMGEPYAFLFALITAVVDGLPILGMGIVLFPLAVYHFMLGNAGYGIGVCVLYLVLTVSRQILEPRILGAGMGVHPLVMLMAMYCGLQIFGVGGMLLAPFCAVTVKNFVGTRREATSSEGG